MSNVIPLLRSTARDPRADFDAAPAGHARRVRGTRRGRAGEAADRGGNGARDAGCGGDGGRGVSEHRLQADVATFLRLALPDDCAWTSVDAGGKSSAFAAGQKLARGVRSGWPDMQFIYGGRFYAIELKVAGGRLSDKQERVRDQIIAAGGEWAEARSLEEVEAALRGWGLPIRASVSASLVPAGQIRLPQSASSPPLAKEGPAARVATRPGRSGTHPSRATGADFL